MLDIAKVKNSIFAWVDKNSKYKVNRKFERLWKNHIEPILVANPDLRDLEVLLRHESIKKKFADFPQKIKISFKRFLVKRIRRWEASRKTDFNCHSGKRFLKKSLVSEIAKKYSVSVERQEFYSAIEHCVSSAVMIAKDDLLRPNKTSGKVLFEELQERAAILSSLSIAAAEVIEEFVGLSGHMRMDRQAIKCFVEQSERNKKESEEYCAYLENYSSSGEEIKKEEPKDFGKFLREPYDFLDKKLYEIRNNFYAYHCDFSIFSSLSHKAIGRLKKSKTYSGNIVKKNFIAAAAYIYREFIGKQPEVRVTKSNADYDRLMIKGEFYNFLYELYSALDMENAAELEKLRQDLDFPPQDDPDEYFLMDIRKIVDEK